ncbi:Na+/H+ antiporter subunit E [Olivibacter sp. XZL3]|uniref:Na+/H+ antiporter subunit E n=1 Tax=Olivibacter sp. XZL3 TaxID=1735116 RepID=UPI001F0FD21C|nr:Na+/H+ antiporter subunit E [Olivibacter sp. XZL3]
MNLLLAFIWIALTGVLAYANFMFGFAIGFFLLWVMNLNESDRRYFTRVPKIISFFLYFLYEMIRANVQVAYDMITPRFFMQPGIVRYPMNARSDFEINLLSTVISLTPGTLILDVSEDRSVLYIHVMYLKDKDRFIQQIKEGFERRLLEIIR